MNTFTDKQFRDLVENASDLIQCVRNDGHFEFVNNAWKKTLGYTEEEIENLIIWDVIHPDHLEACKDIFQDVFTGKNVDYVEVTMITKTGAMIDLEGHINTKCDYRGNIVTTRGIFRDVSRQKKLERENAKQRALIEKNMELHELLSHISTKSVNASGKDLEAIIDLALARFGSFVGADRAYIFNYDFAKRIAINTHEWCNTGVEPQIENLQAVPFAEMSDWVEAHSKGETVKIDDLSLLKKTDSVRLILEPQGVQSLLTIPMIRQNVCYGFIGFDTVKTVHRYTEGERFVLAELSGVLLNILFRMDLEKQIRKQNERLRRERQRVLNLVESSNAIIFEIDTDRRYVSIYGSLLKDMGLSVKDYIGKTATEGFGEDGNARYHAHGRALSGERFIYEWLHTVDGKTRVLETTLSPIYAEDMRITGAVGIVSDVTDQKEHQKKIEHMSNHDFLTDLFNRRYFTRTIEKIAHMNFGLLIIDVNGLKLINDIYGHNKGDELLLEVAGILKSVCQKDEVVTRIGGDEFAIILSETDENEIERMIANIKSHVKRIKIESIDLSLAIGYAIKDDEKLSLETMFKIAEDSMYKNKTVEGKSMRNRAIQGIYQTLIEKHPIENAHAKRVSTYSEKIGQALGLRKEAIKELKLAALLHDIGKISIPDAILNKPSGLTAEEFEIIKTHTEIGYRILRAADEYSNLAEYAYAHHERFDGGGYPRGIKGEDIPLFSRIISVADAYEAMTTDRPYRKQLASNEAIKELRKHAGTQFDPEIVDIMIDIIESTAKDHMDTDTQILG